VEDRKLSICTVRAAARVSTSDGIRPPLRPGWGLSQLGLMVEFVARLLARILFQQAFFHFMATQYYQVTGNRIRPLWLSVHCRADLLVWTQ
jgi:hypothetical protein